VRLLFLNGSHKWLNDTSSRRAADSRAAASATDLLGSNMTLLESLRNAIMGNYQVILSLLSFLDKGKEIKVLVDNVIDSCA
jgi:hypothetical protein